MELDGPARRIKEEMKESGISLDVRPEAFVSMIAELDYARRTPLFERRRTPHAAIVLDGGSLAASEIQVEVVELPYDLDTARHFVDGRAASSRSSSWRRLPQS